MRLVQSSKREIASGAHTQIPLATVEERALCHADSLAHLGQEESPVGAGIDQCFEPRHDTLTAMTGNGDWILGVRDGTEGGLNQVLL